MFLWIFNLFFLPFSKTPQNFQMFHRDWELPLEIDQLSYRFLKLFFKKWTNARIMMIVASNRYIWWCFLSLFLVWLFWICVEMRIFRTKIQRGRENVYERISLQKKRSLSVLRAATREKTGGYFWRIVRRFLFGLVKDARGWAHSFHSVSDFELSYAAVLKLEINVPYPRTVRLLSVNYGLKRLSRAKLCLMLHESTEEIVNLR